MAARITYVTGQDRSRGVGNRDQSINNFFNIIYMESKDLGVSRKKNLTPINFDPHEGDPSDFAEQNIKKNVARNNSRLYFSKEKSNLLEFSGAAGQFPDLSVGDFDIGAPTKEKRAKRKKVN